MKPEYASFTGEIPKRYDQYLGPFIFEPYAIDLASRINTENLESILEIACGTGRLTNHLIKKLSSNTKLIATDLNEDMLSFAQQKIDNSKVTFQVANAQELPFEDNIFDLLICQFGIMFFPEKLNALKEMARVLKPTGEILFSTWDKIENNPIIYSTSNTIASFFKTNPPEFLTVPFSMFDTQAIENLLQNAGFKNIAIEHIKMTGESPNAEDVTMGFVKGNPILQEIADRDATLPEKIIKAVKNNIIKNFGDKPTKSDLSAWVFSANK